VCACVFVRARACVHVFVCVCAPDEEVFEDEEALEAAALVRLGVARPVLVHRPEPLPRPSRRARHAAPVTPRPSGRALL
jgi:hypothetical protein